MTYPLSLKDVSCRYSGQDEPALSGISFDIPPAKICGILGPNGAGKSTILKSALGVIPHAGLITFFGSGFNGSRERIAYIPQRKEIDWDFPVSALDVCLMGLYPKIGIMKWIRKSHKEQAMGYLKQVGLCDLASRPIGALSGGQQQRVFMARALAQDADLFLLDEPMVGVDQTTQSLLFNLFQDLKAKGKTIVIVHHNLQDASDHFDHIILVNKKLIAIGSPKDVFTKETLNSAYGAIAV